MLTDRDRLEETLRSQHELIERQAGELRTSRTQAASMEAALQACRCSWEGGGLRGRTRVPAGWPQGTAG